jgi:hypothetical protein
VLRALVIKRPPVMQCLAPFEPRDAGPRGATATRLPWWSIGIVCTLLVGAAVLANWREVADTLRRHTLLQAELAVCGGTIAGLLISRVDVGPVMRRRLAALEKLYELAATQHSRIEPGYTHYLPCVLLLEADAAANLGAQMRSQSEAALLKRPVGSILYVGPAGVMLRTTHPNEIRVEMGSARQVTAASIALPRSQFARAARIRPRHAMSVRWATGQAILAVPAIGDTLPRLHHCLDETRWGQKR